MPHDLPGDYVDPVADRKRALEQYEREKHLMPSGASVTRSLVDAEPTIRDVFLAEQRRAHSVLIAEARSYLSPATLFDDGTPIHREASLIMRLANALEGK